MSRLGKNPIQIPHGVTVSYDGGVMTVKGPKGELTKTFSEKEVTITLEESTITLAPVPGREKAPALWGTYAAHIHNMLHGVTEGFKKELEVEGVGYRAAVSGNKLVLNVGFSHSIEFDIPADVEVAVEKNLVTITGPDKEVVGQFAANVRGVRPPEPYKGKGVHYVGEYIIRKQGKKAVT